MIIYEFLKKHPEEEDLFKQHFGKTYIENWIKYELYYRLMTGYIIEVDYESYLSRSKKPVLIEDRQDVEVLFIYYS